MRSQRLSHLSKINRSLLDIAERTLDALGEEPAWFFTDLTNDWINLSGALLGACTPEEQLTSLVFADFHSLFREITWFQRLFLWGNYPYVYRNLRFVWELLFRAYYADTYASEHPGGTDLPGPSVDDKNAWLSKREHRLKWDSVFKPILRKLLPP